MIGHLVAIQINYKSKTVFCFGTVDAARCRAALLHVARVLNTFALLRPVVALGVLVRAARIARGEREHDEERGCLHLACRIWPLFLAWLVLFSLQGVRRSLFAGQALRRRARDVCYLLSCVFWWQALTRLRAVQQATGLKESAVCYK